MAFIRPAVDSTFIDTFANTLTPLSSPYTVGSQQAGATGSGVNVTGGTPGICFGSTATRDDWTACYSAINSNKHYVEITIHRVGGYSPPGSHEVEAHVGLTFNASHALSYEFNWQFSGILQVIKWTDPLGNFDTGAVTTVSGSWSGYPAVEGDVLRVEFDSTSGIPVMTVFLNSVQKWVVRDAGASPYLTGSPGFAFFADTGATMSSYCINRFKAGNL